MPRLADILASSGTCPRSPDPASGPAAVPEPPGGPDLARLGLRNYRRLADDLITSGQPDAGQLAEIARAGFGVVINLAVQNDDNALPDERATVEALGMRYEHIPVIWPRPTQADLAAFCAAMDRYADGRRYVHCAANMRVSAFMFLYRVLRLGWPPEAAQADLSAIWQPNPTWQAFIDEALAHPPAANS